MTIFNIYNNIIVRNRNNLNVLETDTCFENLIKSKPATWCLIDNHSTSAIEEIAPGTILLNQFSSTILVNNEHENLKGTNVA